MNPSIKLILVIIITFLISIATSLLLEIPIFKHWLRQIIIILLIVIEIFCGYIIFKSILSK